MIEIIDHTADVGIRVKAQDLKELFKESGKGLYKVMLSLRRETFDIEEEVMVSIDAEDQEELLITWLNELLYLFESKRLVFKDVDFLEFTSHSLKANLKCFKVNDDEMKRYVKAATYHNLSIKRNEDGSLEATVIFDI